MHVINIGKDFSQVPSGRYDPQDGGNSGERFRREFLLPIVRAGTLTNIILDDEVEGYGSSFLDEAFGGLVRHAYAKSDDILNLFTFSYENPDFEYYEDRIKQYLNSAIHGSDVGSD